jgi:ABC-type multidrug transport system fused ATPase/permease subunit
MKPFNFFGTNHNLALLARRYYWTAGVVMLLASAISLLEGLGVGLLIPLLGILSGDLSPGRTSHTPVNLLATLAAGHSRDARLWIIAGVILAAVVLKTALQASANSFASWVDGRIGQDVRCGLGRRLNSVGYPFFLAENPSRLFNILGTESWKASDAVRVLFAEIAATANVLMFSILLLIVSWRLALLALVGGLLTRTIQKRLENKLRRLSRDTVAVNQSLHNRMLFVIFSARVIRIFNTQRIEQEHFEMSSDEVRRAILKSERISGTQGPLLEAMHGALLVTVLLAAIFTGTSLPVLATFLVLMNRVQPHLRTLEGTSAAFAAATAHFEEVEWLLDASNKASAPVGVVPFTGLRDHIVFEKVTHDYGTRNAPALTDVSFVLRRGRATALLGESGSGKSTIINLLCRLLEPTSGTIRVDGTPLHDLQVADWLSSIAIAGQDIELIDGTIAENLAYGRPETTRDDIEEAVRAAHADFVPDLPLGLDTPIGPGGMGLSGGQRQRIGLARALVRKPELLILDEATNALDYATEQGILRVLQELRGAMTMLVVNHKADSLAFCDDAIVLRQGKLVSAGPVASVLRELDAGWLAEEGASRPLL